MIPSGLAKQTTIELRNYLFTRSALDRVEMARIIKCPPSSFEKFLTYEELPHQYLIELFKLLILYGYEPLKENYLSKSDYEEILAVYEIQNQVHFVNRTRHANNRINREQ